MKTVAVIGCGKFVEGKEGWAIGHAHADGYLKSGHEVKLLGVDVSPENLKAFGEKYKLPADQLFASTEALYAAGIPDCASVCTWPALHHPMVMEALQKGVKAVICEKPFTLDVGEQREIEHLAAKKGAIVAIAHQRRLEAPFKALKQVVQSGALGANLEVRARVGDGWDILSWTTHWFDMANFMFDSAPEWVLAGMAIGDTRRYKQAVEDASVILAHYTGDRQAVFVTGPRTGADFRVVGDKGLARIGKGAIEVLTADGVTHVPFDSAAPGGFVQLATEVLATLDGKGEPMCSIKRSAVATEMAYAAHESARTGKKVAMPFTALYAPLDIAQHPVRSALWGKKLLLYADEHFGSGGREGIVEAFGSITGQAIAVVDAAKKPLVKADVAGVDAILIYHTQKDVAASTRAVLTAWVKAGKPLFIVHAGLGAWPKWKTYADWCGHIWEWGVSVHPHEPTVLKPAGRDPLAFGWSEGWLPKDEVFVKLKKTAPTVTGLTADISIGTFPAAWRHKKLPNIGAWMPGHRRDSWNIPAMREGAARTLMSLFRA